MAKKKPYRYILYLACRAAAGIFYLLPRECALGLARILARLGYLVISRQRTKTLRHLDLAFGKEKTRAQKEAVARKVFEHSAMTAAEVLQFPKLNAKKIEKIVDLGNALEVYRSLLSEGRGLISITAHIGNWELLAGVFGLLGFRGAVLARRIYYEPYNQWIVGLRQSLHVPTLYRDQSSKEILKRLARSEIIGLLPDQDVESLKGIFVPFFGRPAYTPVAPVRLALASQSPMICNFLIRKPDGSYRMILGDVIRPAVQSSREEAIEKYTTQWMANFEKVIREYPEQWAWMHNRWKTRVPVEEVTGVIQ